MVRVKALTCLLTFASMVTATLHADWFCWEFGGRMGYRWDRLDHRIKADHCCPTFKEEFNNLSTAQVEAFTKLRLWWLEAGVDADYGWTVGGGVDTAFSFMGNSGSRTECASFHSDANGEVWDLFLTAGLRAPFYDYCEKSFYITPLGGYSYHQIQEKRHYTHPDTVDLGPTTLFNFSGNPAFASIPLTSRLKRNYQGPFAGVSMSILYCRFYTNFGYAYHWIDFDQELPFFQHLELFTANDTVNLFQATSTAMVAKRNRGNRGWLSLNYQDPCGWRAGLRGTYFSVSTHKGKSTTTTCSTLSTNGQSVSFQNTTSSPFKTRLRTFTIMGEAAYVF